VLEIISITIVGLLLFVLVLTFGADPMPDDPPQAVCAVCATIFLAISFGIPNAVISLMLPIWNVATVMIIILAYVSSGILFVPSTLPEQIRVPLSYNPLLQCTEWLRSAYYFDYPTFILDKVYVLEFSLISLTIGLVMMRLFSRFF
jgi:capsular polysaccharide transport system permease protein